MDTNRLSVLKTYKLYIGGKFPRTESGRYYVVEGVNGPMANVCRASRKDFRNAVQVARKAVDKWAGLTAYNRSQILYRIGEVMEGRKAQFIEELTEQGLNRKDAEAETLASIDALIHYAGWCDKFQQVFSAVNPVASSHFNFTVHEPTGVVALIAPEKPSLLGLVTHTAAILAGGNSCVVLASESQPLSSITFAEVLHASDVPGGVVNVLTGSPEELTSHFSSHMDVNALILVDQPDELVLKARQEAVNNVKRVFVRNGLDHSGEDVLNPYLILDTTEAKTTWHPIENTAGSGSGY